MPAGAAPPSPPVHLLDLPLQESPPMASYTFTSPESTALRISDVKVGEILRKIGDFGALYMRVTSDRCDPGRESFVNLLTGSLVDFPSNELLSSLHFELLPPGTTIHLTL